MLSNQEFLQAVRGLRDEWVDLLGKEDASALAAWLEDAAGEDQEAIRQATNRVLDLLQRHPQAKARLIGELGIKGDADAALRGLYAPAAGGPDAVPAGTLMVCPVDPAHYRQRLRQKDQQLLCPQHGVPLVPADSLKEHK